MSGKKNEKKKDRSDGWHWEKSIAPDGSVHGALRYSGGWYRFDGTEAVLRKKKLSVTVFALAGLAFYAVCLLVPVTRADSMVLSAALIIELFPAVWCLAGLFRLLTAHAPFEVSVPRKSVVRLRRCSAGAFLCGAVSWITQLVLMIAGQTCSRFDLLFLLLMLLSLAALLAARIILQRISWSESREKKKS